MKPKRHIAFFIVFPIAVILLGALGVFYLDLANGPMALLFIYIAALLGLVVSSVLLLKKRMRFRLIPWGAFLITAGLAIGLAKPSTENYKAYFYDNPTYTEVLHLEDGDIKGVYNQDKSVEIYAGIPYAEAPIGELRWKEPQPVKPWEGVRDGSYFAPKAMQVGRAPVIDSLVDLYAEKSWHPDYRMHPIQKCSEDCLYLNIWRPSRVEGPLPILVYIHGGSLTTGSAAYTDYNGETMAKQNVIMINIAYRLGVFGYFAHPELAAESPNGTTGNYGLLDQIEALKWIKRNASSFGGDASNITVAGESAGSSSVSALCTSPLAKNLFKNAIMESSSVALKNPPHTFRTKATAYETGENIVKEMGCKNIEELRKVPAEKLVRTGYSNSSMMLDGYALTKMPVEVYEAGENNETNLLNGYNVTEADAFVVPAFLFSPTDRSNIQERLAMYFNEDIAKKIVDVYQEKIQKDAFSAFNEIISVYWFIHPHHAHSLTALEAGVNVYRYQFTKENGYYGTNHSGEMIYAYGNFEKSGHSFAYNESDYALSKTMNSYWGNFAKTGNPNGADLPTWDLYQSNGKVMELGLNVGPIEDRYQSLYPIIDEYSSSLSIDWGK